MRLSPTIAAAALAALFALHAPAASAQPRATVDSVLSALDRVKTVRETALSSDGAWVAWVERVPVPDGDDSRSAVRLTPRSGGAVRTVSAATDGGPRRERAPRFSPDGKSLAFLSDAAKEGQMQLYVLSLGGTAPARPRRLTSVNGQLADPRWSPDGRSLAVLFISGSKQEAGALVAHKPDAGVVEESLDEQRIAVVNATTGLLRPLSPPNLFVYDYDWSPDGKRFVAEAAEGSGTNNYWIAQLYVVETPSGHVRSIWKPPLQLACPRFSPDGQAVAVIHGLMSDEGATGGDVYVVPADGSVARNVTPGLPASASALDWRPSGEILFSAHRDGGSAVLSVRPGGTVETLWWAPEHVTGLSLAEEGRLSAVVRQSFTSPPEVWAGEVGHWDKVSRLNGGIVPPWGDGKSLHWENGGLKVQGWLLSPKKVDPSRKYPLVVAAHGGPAAQAGASWPVRWNAVLPTQGYFVFVPNFRGSYGQGEAFTQANVKDFGNGDLQDILKGVDAVLAAAPIDPERIGIMGWSYGGYMTMWALTQTGRFKAGVAGAGIANWQSYYGQNRIDRWMIPYFGASVYDDPLVYAKSSPINFIKSAKAPTLVLHGDRDSEVPTPQGYEYWHALKTLGVPTQLVIYEGEGHAIARPEHQRDMQKRVVAWFDKWLVSR
jgi:dipeptidyl aminopeptidase/acylaminoacyl peptidase